MKNICAIVLFSAFFFAQAVFAPAVFAVAQSTAFTYQGHLLQNGTPTSGSHDLSFTLWDSESGGTQVGPTVSQAAYPVASGVFTIDLDFGANRFSGGERWLDVKVDNTELTPRQPVNGAPYAQYVLSGSNGVSVNGSTTTSEFSNDHLYAGVNVIGQNSPMVMQASPAFDPPGTSTQTGFSGAVDVYSLTSALANSMTLGGTGGGGAGKATAPDVRMLVRLDAAYTGLAKDLFTGIHIDNLEIDVLQSSSSTTVVQSYCYGLVYVTGLQPMPQAGVYEMTIVAGQIGFKFPLSPGSTTYVQGGWNFVTNTSLSTAPCIS